MAESATPVSEVDISAAIVIPNMRMVLSLAQELGLTCKVN
jgi:hypothetical protein